MNFDAVLTLIEAKWSECEDMRPYKVFPTPFYSPLSPDRLRGTTWQDFLQAMAATGFNSRSYVSPHGSSRPQILM
jgi:hypothetical protein